MRKILYWAGSLLLILILFGIIPFIVKILLDKGIKVENSVGLLLVIIGGGIAILSLIKPNILINPFAKINRNEISKEYIYNNFILGLGMGVGGVFYALTGKFHYVIIFIWASIISLFIIKRLKL